MSRASRMVGSFLQDFMYGYQDSFAEHEYQYDHDRISNKVAETTADDFNDYQSRFTSNRRIGENFGNNYVENPPLIQKVDPKVARVVEMLKHLKPKANANDSFIIRYARALNTLSIDEKSSAAVLLKEIAKYLLTSHRDMAKSVRPLNDTRDGDVEGRGIGAPYVNSDLRRISSGAPPGLPGYEDLPPADCMINEMNKFSS